MKFIYPEILWALFALAIPILVHLFNFRKFRKILFPNVSFLKEVKQETKSKSRFKHLLILFSRLLALSAIILAFAQPYIPKVDQVAETGKRLVSIYIDNSFSMQAEAAEGPSFEVSRNKALSIIDRYRPTDRFHLITNDFESKHERIVGKSEAEDWIEEISLSAQSRDLDEVFQRQRTILSKEEEEKAAIYWLSDLQKNTTPLEKISIDTSFQTSIVPTFAEETGNVYIDSIWFDTPIRQLNRLEKLHIRIKNTLSAPRANIPMKLFIDGQQKAIGSFNTIPDLVTDTVLNFSNDRTGDLKLKVIIDDYPVTFDDQMFFSYNVAENINVLRIHEPEYTKSPIKAIFADDIFYQLKNSSIGNVDYSIFQEFDLIVLDELETLSSGIQSEIKQFYESGGSVLLIPADEINLKEYNALLSTVGIESFGSKNKYATRVDDIAVNDQLYKDVFEKLPENIDLPDVLHHFPQSRNTNSNSDVLLRLKTGSAYLTRITNGRGKFYTVASPLDQENTAFAQHAIFVPTILRIAEFSQTQSPLYYTIGKDAIIPLNKTEVEGDQIFRLRNTEKQFDLLTEHRNTRNQTEVFVHNELQDDGLFELILGDKTEAIVAFNYDRQESDFRAVSDEMLNSFLEAGGQYVQIFNESGENLKKAITALEEGKKLWFNLIIFALVMLAIETLLIKFWR